METAPTAAEEQGAQGLRVRRWLSQCGGPLPLHSVAPEALWSQALGQTGKPQP